MNLILWYFLADLFYGKNQEQLKTINGILDLGIRLRQECVGSGRFHFDFKSLDLPEFTLFLCGNIQYKTYQNFEEPSNKSSYD